MGRKKGMPNFIRSEDLHANFEVLLTSFYLEKRITLRRIRSYGMRMMRTRSMQSR